jgi:sugar phosphate permease
LDSVEQISSFRLMPRFLRPPPPAAPITDPAEVRRVYGRQRARVLLWSTAGYGTFYFVRKNLSVAMPAMQAQLHLSKTDLGLILTLHGLFYGVSKFLNGIAADRANARTFMATALIICAIVNVFFGLASSLIFLGLFWMINGWFQGMGYPPCARLLTHWYSPKELASKMSIWNISHSLGGAAIVLLCANLMVHFNNWRICFFVPAGIALAMGGLLLLNLRDTPESIGLPPVERTAVPPIRAWGFCISMVAGTIMLCAAMRLRGQWSWAFAITVATIVLAMSAMVLLNLRDTGEPMAAMAVQAQTETDEALADFKAFLWKQVFSNKYIWLVSIANFFVYTIRFAIFDWGPTLLKEYKGMQIIDGAGMVAGFEVAGLFGMLVTGWMTDKFFGGRGTPLSMISMLLCGGSIFLFWKTPAHAVWLNTALLAAAGFFVYGPQALVAVVVANLATKKAAATAVGLTSIFGYASTVLSGYGMGLLVEHYGWGRAFVCLIGIAVAGAALFAAALPAKAHGYGDDSGGAFPVIPIGDKKA